MAARAGRGRPRLKIVGLGGSLRAASRSRAALAVALDGAAAAGAEVELLDLRRLGLPMFSPDQEAHPPAVVVNLIDTCYDADGMLWSSPMYNGSVSGSFKVPYVVPVPQATRAFSDSGAVQDEMIESQLRTLGAEVVRVAERIGQDPAAHRQVECDDAAERVALSG